MKFIKTEDIELEKALNKNLLKKIVAFLNTKKGTIYLGIDENGNLLGVSNVHKTMLKVRDIFINEILPSSEGLYEIIALMIDEKIIIKINITKGSKLYYIKKEGMNKKGCFYRDGTKTLSMNEEEIERRFVASLNNKRTLVKDISINRDDLKFESLRDKLRGKGVHINDETFLKNFNLVKDDGSFNLLADLLSDENRISLAVCVFKGKDKTDYLMRNEYGNKSLISASKDVISYCEAINPTYIDVSSRPRKEKKMFNNKAFEEAWINACVHNLWDTHISPQVYIYEDRLEIESQGGLPYGLSEEEFLSGVSKPVNPDLMDIFKSCHIVERSGHGVPEVVKVYGKEAYKFYPNTIIVTIPFDKSGFSKKEFGTVNGTVNGTLNNSDELSENERKVVEEIYSNCQITRKELSENTDISIRSISRVISSLKNKGIIHRVGSDKSGYWEINNK